MKKQIENLKEEGNKMKSEQERRDIFRDNILPCPFIDEYEQFQIWEDGFRVGYCNGTDDMRNNKECAESAARNADIQDAYERGFDDGVDYIKKQIKNTITWLDG